MSSHPVESAQDAVGGTRFLRSALMMLGGVAGAQIINLLAMPVVTRIFPPEALGVHALFVSAAASLTVLATLRLDLAVVLPREQSVAVRIWWLGFYQGLAAALLIGAVALVLGGWINASFAPGVSSAAWVWLLAPMVIASVVTQMGTGLATRQGRFDLVVLSNLATALVFASTAMAIGWLAPGDQGVVVARLSGQTAGCLSLIALAIVVCRRGGHWRPRLLRARELWREQRQFLVFNTPYSLVGALARDLPLYVFALGGGAALTASYALARTIMLAPTSLISGALSSVFYREASRHLGTPRLEALAIALSRWGLFLTIPGFAFVAVWGDELFALVFGDQWRAAGTFARLLAVPMWLALQTGWPERLFEASRRQGVSFTIQIGFDALHALVVTGTYFGTGNAVLAVGAYAVTYSTYHLVYLVAVFRVAGFDLSALRRIMVRAVGGFALVTGAFSAFRAWMPMGTQANFFAAAVVAAVATGILVRVNLVNRDVVGEPAGHHLDSEDTDD